jgi:hypothetical protein
VKGKVFELEHPSEDADLAAGWEWRNAVFGSAGGEKNGGNDGKKKSGLHWWKIRVFPMTMTTGMVFPMAKSRRNSFTAWGSLA